MKSLDNKNKIQILPITEDLVIEILTNKKEPFSFSFISDLYNDENIPNEKISQFLQQLFELQRKNYVKLNIQKNGMLFSITNKYKWDKFHDSRKIRTLSIVMGLLLATLAIWNPFNCNYFKKQNNIIIDDSLVKTELIKGLWSIDSIFYYKEGILKKIELRADYHIEFNNFNDIVFFNKDSIFYSKNVNLLKSSWHTENEFLNPILFPFLGIIELPNSKGKEYEVKSLTKKSMLINYETVSLKSNNLKNLKETYIVFKYLNNTLYGKTKDEKWFELQKDLLAPAKIIVHLSKNKNQNLLNELFYNKK